MTNPMIQFLRQSPQGQVQNNPLAMVTEFRKFASGMTPEAAKKRVEQLLASGQMSKAQFDQLKQQAEDFAKFLK